MEEENLWLRLRAIYLHNKDFLFLGSPGPDGNREEERLAPQQILDAGLYYQRKWVAIYNEPMPQRLVNIFAALLLTEPDDNSPLPKIGVQDSGGFFEASNWWNAMGGRKDAKLVVEPDA